MSKNIHPDSLLSVEERIKKYKDGYDDEFYWEYQKAYSNHEGSVHPSRPRKLPKDLKIEYLDQYENENPKIEIPDIDEELEAAWNVQTRDNASIERSFEIARDSFVKEEMVASIEIDGKLPKIALLLFNSIVARRSKHQLKYTDFFERIIIHTKALSELKMLQKPIFHEIGMFIPGPIISWHDFNLHLLLSSTKHIDEWKFVSSIWELMDSMTIRQKAMYDLLNQGLSYRQIGKLCNISHVSVSDHLKAIKKKAANISLLVNENVDTQYSWLISYLHIGIHIDTLLNIGPLSKSNTSE